LKQSFGKRPFALDFGYPRRFAAASLKRLDVVPGNIRVRRYPRRFAAASLKRVDVLEAIARRFVIRGDSPRLH